VRVCFFSLSFALALGPRYLPTTRFTTMAAMLASAALAIGDDRMSVSDLLRARRERPRHRRAAKPRNELAPVHRCNHSVTSSASR
jgi:hypothetical protein